MRGRDEAFPMALITISLRYFRFAMRSALNRGTHYITPRIVHKKGLIARSAKGSLCKTAHFANVALPELRGALGLQNLRWVKCGGCAAQGL